MFVLHLWLPILVSAVAVFLLSSVIHMLTPWHKSDYPKLANEDAVSDALRALNIPAGEYFAPRPADRAGMRSPEFAERVKRGPVFMINIFPAGGMNMGRGLGLWFLYCLIVNGFAGHIAEGAGLMRTDDHRILHTVGLSAFLGYAAALWQGSVWYRRPWLTTFKGTVDGLIYAAVTALIFTWLWPA
jgi:hypothetical protein